VTSQLLERDEVLAKLAKIPRTAHAYFKQLQAEQLLMPQQKDQHAKKLSLFGLFGRKKASTAPMQDQKPKTGPKQ